MNSWQEQIAEVKAQLASIEKSLAFLVAAKQMETDLKTTTLQPVSRDSARRQAAEARAQRLKDLRAAGEQLNSRA